MVCVLALTLAMSVCAFAADTVTEDEAANYKSAAETLISQIAGFSDEEIENYLAQDDAFTTATMESWKSVKDELGAYSSIVSQDVEKDGDVVTISTVAQFEKAKADLEAVEADQTLSRQQAKYTYDSSTAYGSYIDTEYITTLQELQNAVDSAASALEQAQTSLEDYQAQLEEVTTAYEDAAQVLSNCQYSLNNTDPADDTYGYVYFAQLTTQAQSTADSLEQQKEELEQKVEQAEENVTTAETAYNKAKRELGQGKLTAAETKKLRTLAYNTAQETYDIALGYLEQDLSDQQETYDETLEKWNEFSTYIDGNAVCTRYNGVITGVELEAGDKISTGTSLVTLYDMDEVTMTVTVDEDDMTDISLGSAANIALTAYPEDIFTAKVTAIGDATSDSSGNITYDVTVTLEGDVSGLFQGMTGDVTFVTEQTEEVLYVSRRAIITEDDKTYVKVKTADGSIVKKE